MHEEVRWNVPAITENGRLRQADRWEFETSLGYTVFVLKKKAWGTEQYYGACLQPWHVGGGNRRIGSSRPASLYSKFEDNLGLKRSPFQEKQTQKQQQQNPNQANSKPSICILNLYLSKSNHSLASQFLI